MIYSIIFFKVILLKIDEVINELKEIRKKEGNVEVSVTSSEYGYNIEKITIAENLVTGKNDALIVLDG